MMCVLCAVCCVLCCFVYPNDTAVHVIVNITHTHKYHTTSLHMEDFCILMCVCVSVCLCVYVCVRVRLIFLYKHCLHHNECIADMVIVSVDVRACCQYNTQTERAVCCDVLFCSDNDAPLHVIRGVFHNITSRIGREQCDELLGPEADYVLKVRARTCA